MEILLSDLLIIIDVLVFETFLGASRCKARRDKQKRLEFGKSEMPIAKKDAFLLGLEFSYKAVFFFFYEKAF